VSQRMGVSRLDAGPERAGGEVDRALLDWRGAQARVTAYLVALGLGAAAARRWSRQVLERALGRSSSESAVADAMDEVPRTLLESHPLPSVPAGAGPESAFLAWRLAAWSAGGVADEGPLAAPAWAPPTPPLRRARMVSERFLGRRVGEWGRRHGGHARRGAPDPEREMRERSALAWRRRGRWRRVLLAALVVVPSVLAGAAFLAALPARVWLPAEIALAVAFGALFGWISVGFWTACFGFGVLLRGSRHLAVAPSESEWESPPMPPICDGDAGCRTAVVMPVCDEPVDRVFAGLRATRASLARAGAVRDFDFFVLSDSVDPDVCADEEIAWARWREEAREGGGIFYRRRRIRQKRKSGNVADFCRRFGRRYRYMVVLDADSVMSGDTLVRLVRRMEAHPHVGIIQTAPRIVRSRSLLARVQQFASRLYGPMFAAGMHYWQLGDSPYWGHNAIVRVEPFMEHCALPRLSGRPPFGGDILSHDFVEAALLGRAGWSIWLAFDLAGSYEEAPGSLLEEMKRDQRWCQGNLQHLRLLFTEGVSSAHRALFLNGVFSYVSAVLWLVFLAASTTEAVIWAIRGPDYFAAGPSLFPTWPIWRPERAAGLLAAVFTVLLLPKLLAFGLALLRGDSKGFGGAWSLLRSVLLEAITSALFAPIRMAFYCRFVLRNLLGRAVSWRGGADDLGETTWRRAWRHHGLDTTVASLWAFCVYWLHPSAFWWLAPVAGALVLSVPLSVWYSRPSLGERARSMGLCATPEERDPPPEIRALEAELARVPSRRRRWTGFEGAVVDPLRNAIHVALRRGARKLPPKVEEERCRLVEHARLRGPSGLSRRERRILLGDAAALAELHARVWRLEAHEAEGRWTLDPESAASSHA